METLKARCLIISVFFCPSYLGTCTQTFHLNARLVHKIKLPINVGLKLVCVEHAHKLLAVSHRWGVWA